MPVAFEISLEASCAPPRKLWTRDEVHLMETVGLDTSHLELIDGELIDKMGKNRPHVFALHRLVACLQLIFDSLLVNAEAPIDVAETDNPRNLPEPDVIVLKPQTRGLPKRTPRPDDLHLVAEVSDSTLSFDLTVKAALYARAGIAEYWVLDVTRERLIVHRAPSDGVYTSVGAYSRTESVAPLSAPDDPLPVAALFPIFDE